MAETLSMNLNDHAVRLEWQAPSEGRSCFVLVHGGGLDHEPWMPVARHLAREGYGLIAPDLPGHGRSAGAARADVPSMAGWLLDLIQALTAAQAMLGKSPLIIAGHSMGSMIALECAAAAGRGDTRLGARIAGIALLGTAFPLAVAPALLDMAKGDEAAARQKINGWSHATPRPGEGEVTPAMAAAMAANLAAMERQATGVLHTDFRACAEYADGLRRAAELSCPTLLLLGEKDRMTPPRGAEGLAAKLQLRVPATTEILPGAGHNLMGEQPERVTKVLIAFADRIDRP